jgi:hypothetical protein
MQHTRTWQDVYGGAHASFGGRAGGHRWLVAAPPELASGLSTELAAVEGKGETVLLIHDGLTPLLAAVRELNPRGVLVVAPTPLSGGPTLQLPERTLDGAGGLTYREGGAFPAWTGAANPEAPRGECPPASAAASLGAAVVVTDPAGVRAALETWMDATPHGR